MKNQKGQSMTEYILIVALIALVAFVAIKTLGKKTKAGFKKAAKQVEEATNQSR